MLLPTLPAELRTGTSGILKYKCRPPAGDRFNGRRQRAVLGFKPAQCKFAIQAVDIDYEDAGYRAGRDCDVAIRPRTPPLLYCLRIGGGGLKALRRPPAPYRAADMEKRPILRLASASAVRSIGHVLEKSAAGICAGCTGLGGSKRDVIVHVVRHRRLWRRRLGLWQFALGRRTDADAVDGLALHCVVGRVQLDCVPWPPVGVVFACSAATASQFVALSGKVFLARLKLRIVLVCSLPSSDFRVSRAAFSIVTVIGLPFRSAAFRVFARKHFVSFSHCHLLLRLQVICRLRGRRSSRLHRRISLGWCARCRRIRRAEARDRARAPAMSRARGAARR